jgi:hypothetical protein
MNAAAASSPAAAGSAGGAAGAMKTAIFLEADDGFYEQYEQQEVSVVTLVGAAEQC